MGSRGQTVIELLLLLTISILALSIIYSIYSTQIEYSNISRESLIAKTTISKLVNSANSLALSGAGSTQKVLIEIPSDANMLDSNIIGKTILITLSNGSSVFGSADVNIVGEFKKSGGLFVVDGYFVNLTFDGEKVVMSYDDFELNTNGIFVSAKQGTSVEKIFTIRNNSSREATFWISKDFSFEELVVLNISEGDDFFVLGPNEVRVIDFNLVLSEFSSGNYAGAINIIGQINDGVSDYNVNKSILVSVESILEFEPVMIFPKITSFTTDANELVSKRFSVCNSTSELINSIEWSRNSNPDANMLEWFTWPIVDVDGAEINSVASGDCKYFDLNFIVPESAVSNIYDANVTLNYGDGNTSSAYFFINVTRPQSIYSLFFSTSNNTLPANYFLSSFLTQKTDANYFTPSGELDWNLSDNGSELDSSNYLYDSDLIALWHFNDKNSSGYVLNSVSEIRDASLNSGADVNAIGLWDSNGVFLNGFDGGLTLPNVSLSSTFSYSAWIYPIHSTGMTWNSLFANDCDVGIYYMEDSQKISFYYSDTDHLTNTPLIESMWHHVVVTNNAGSVTFYIDGVIDGSSSSAPGFIANKIGTDSCDEAFNGYIDEVAVWDRELSETEVGRLYKSQSSWFDNNLIAYYKFNDKNASGYILDSATGEYNGRLTNGADTNGVGLWDSNAGYFDGVDDYVRISHSESLEPSEITMSVWIYPTSWSHNSVATSLFSKRSTYYNGFFLFYLTGQGSINWDWCDLGNIPNRWNTGYNPPLNTWTNLVAVRNSTGRYLYVNGNLFNSTVSAGSSSAISSGSDLYIGHDFVSSAYRFKGFMEEAKIYDRALSELEVIQDYNSFLNAKFVDLNIIDAGEVVDWDSFVVNSDVNYSFGREICGVGDLGCSLDEFNDGLVGLWHLNASGLGIDYNDYSLNLNTGSCSTTCPVQTSGLWDTNAVLFSSGKYVDLNKKDSLNASSALTLSTWINLTSANTNNGILFKGALSSSQGVYSLGFFNGSSSKLTARLNGSISEGSGQLTSPNILIPGIWYHVVFVYDGSKMYLYENGLLVASNNYSIPISVTTETLKLGCYYSTGFCFNGSVDDVAMWSRALTATEVSDLYRKGVSRLDLNVYSCSDSLCATKTGAQNISNASNSVWVNLNSSVLNSRYLGIEAYFLKARGFEDYNAENFWVGSYLKDFNILFYN